MAAFAMVRSEQRSEPEMNETRDILFLLGGLSLMVFGAGLVITSPVVRKLLGEANLTGLLQGAAPDLERYMRIRSM